jgi:AP-1 complex subunit sigma 1/2
VCELDLIFNFHKAYFILDEVLVAGELQETSKKLIARLVSEQDALVEAAKLGHVEEDGTPLRDP